LKVKLDENVPNRVGTLLAARGHDIDTVVDEGRAGQSDAVVRDVAVQADRMLLTLDRGFPSLASLSAADPGVIVLRPSFQSAPAVEAAIEQLLANHTLEDLRDCIVVVAPGRIRVRRAPRANE
jgi:predicted nuclease of predicted toxin-antitoxin system